MILLGKIKDIFDELYKKKVFDSKKTIDDLENIINNMYDNNDFSEIDKYREYIDNYDQVIKDIKDLIYQDK